MIELEAVSVAYGSGPRVVDALTERVASGEWLGLIGPNGAGKSSVLRAIAGLLDHEGRIVVNGRPGFSPVLSPEMLAALRARYPSEEQVGQFLVLWQASPHRAPTR